MLGSQLVDLSCPADELQDVPQPPEIDYEAIRSALFEAPIIVPAAVKERFSKMDPFALPEDKEAESWDYFMKGTSDGESSTLRDFWIFFLLNLALLGSLSRHLYRVRARHQA